MEEKLIEITTNFKIDEGELIGTVDMTFLAAKVVKELEVIHA